MKMRKILSMLLAVLMVLTALPLTFVGAMADEAAAEAAATAKPGTAPETLPNGKTYASATFHTNDVAADHRKNSGGNWLGNFGASAWAMMQDGAEGIMFKVDTSKAAASVSNTLSMTFAASFTGYRADGSKMDTYIIATPKQAAGWSANVVATAEEVSTWYYSNDGATWNEVSIDGVTGSYVDIPVGKQVTYV